MNRRTRLLLILALLAAFEAGVAFDRWLHRPIRVAGMMLRLTNESSDAAPAAKCYSDKPEACPRGQAQAPVPFKLRPWTGPCPFTPLRNEACQQET